MQAIAAGKGDIASIGLEPIIQGYEKGVRMTAFLSRDPHLQQVLGVLDGSPIRTLADFKGTTIGELSLGQPGEIYTSVMLAGAGLTRATTRSRRSASARKRSRRSPAAASPARRFPGPN